MSEHSPLPWSIVGSLVDQLYYIGGANAICDIHRSGYVENGDSRFHRTPKEDEANAEFIVKAVNCHDELLAALKAFMRAPSIGSSGPGSVTIEVQSFNLKAAEAAIKAAEGGA